MTRRTVAAVLLAGALSGCGEPGSAGCPAVFLPEHPNLTVHLSGDWSPHGADTVVLRCDPTCAEEAGALTEVLDSGEAWFDVPADRESVVVTVLDRQGTELAELATGLEFRPEYGEGCGGPLHATVTVPAP